MVHQNVSRFQNGSRSQNGSGPRVVRLLIFSLLLLGPAAALIYYGWADRVLSKAILDNGVETKATITNAVIRHGKHNSEDYLIDLSWRDAAKQERAIKSASVSGKIWSRLVSGNKLVVNEIPIRYLESDTEPHAIFVWDEDYTLRVDFFMICGGVALALLGGAILVLGLRSKPTAPGRPARA